MEKKLKMRKKDNKKWSSLMFMILTAVANYSNQLLYLQSIYILKYYFSF